MSSEVSKQKQSESQLLRLPHVDPGHVGVGEGAVVVVCVTPMHEQALEYRTLPEQADA